MYLGYITLVPIRLALLIPHHIICCALIVFVLLGSDGEVTGCRKFFYEWLIYAWQRGHLFLMGYYYIPVTGKKELPNPDEHSSYVVIGNHAGWMEVGWMFGQYTPSFVGKSSIKDIPVFGRIAIANRTIFIDRMAKNSGGVTGQIVDRLKTGGKVGMFPEGTTSNGTSICTFKSGAFVAGVPVVPLVFKYPYCMFDPCFCACSLKWQMLGTMAQVYSCMTVQRLPVYYPSEAEKADPKLYASNVKKLLVEESGLIDSQETYEDKLEWEESVGYMNAEVAKKRREDMKRKNTEMSGTPDAALAV